MSTAGAPASAEIEGVFWSDYRQLPRLGLLLCGRLDVAEELVQDAYAGLWSRSAVVARPSSRSAYLRKSAVGGARSNFRRGRTASKHLHEFLPLPSPAADRRLMTQTRDIQLILGLNQLASRQREVLILRFWLECSFAEIAEMLRITIGAATATATKAVQRLRKMLDREE